MQQLAFKAYNNVTQRTASDKHLEYALFTEITHYLREIDKDETPAPALWADAIDRNLQLWTILTVDLLNPTNQLTPELKRGLLNLADIVRRTSHRVLAGSDELPTLIDINETIMEGLQAGQSAPAAAVA